VIHPVRFIQTTAQKTKELSVFQVYILLIDAYFGALHDEEHLNIYDPSLTTTLGAQTTMEATPIDRLRPTGVKATRDLDPRTKKVQNMLKEAMQERFYKRYHPLRAYKKKGNKRGQTPEYHFSYLIDMQALLHPALSNGKLVEKMIISFNDITLEDKECFCESIMRNLWGTIERLVERVAFRKLTDGNEDVTETNVAPVLVVPQRKRQRVEEDPTLALLESLIESTVTEQINERTLTPIQVAQKEITYYRNVPRELWPKFEETVIWWCSRQTREKMPCLAQVACALLAGKPSSGGLECDFGALKEIISPKRASISQGFVEIEMMMKINKSLVHSAPEKVFQLPNDKWKEYTPSRPVIAPIHDLPIDDTESDDDSWNICGHNYDDGVYVPNDNMGEEKETGNEGESVISEVTCNSSKSSAGFGINEYSDIYLPTQPAITESQLSTHRVFDSQETEIPGSLS
jgi:hypothetical protein